MCRTMVGAIAVGLVVASPVGLRAATSGLLIIPTADTVGAGLYQLQLALYSGTPHVRNQWFLQNEIGIGDRWEFGADFNLHFGSDPAFLGNAKYSFPASKRLQLAVGFSNWEEQLSSGAFFLGTNDLGAVRLTAGLTNVYGVNRFLAGVDTGFDHGVTYMADYTSGAGAYSSAGVSFQFGSRLSLQVGAVFPNDGGQASIIAQFAFTSPIRSGR